VQLAGWLGDTSDPAPDPERFRAETPSRIGLWNELGRTLCGAFLSAAEVVLARAA